MLHFLLFFLIAFAVALPSYANTESMKFGLSETDSFFNEYLPAQDSVYEYEDLLNLAESNASPEGKAVLTTARSMITSEAIVLGSCWDYINAIYDRAGFTSKLRVTSFKSKKEGPYAVMNVIRPGDWLYFINHSYGDVEHSGIFVEWIDEENKEALLISYAGGNRVAPARYKSYDLSSVYNIIRPKAKKLK